MINSGWSSNVIDVEDTEEEEEILSDDDKTNEILDDESWVEESVSEETPPPSSSLASPPPPPPPPPPSKPSSPPVQPIMKTTTTNVPSSATTSTTAAAAVVGTTARNSSTTTRSSSSKRTYKPPKLRPEQARRDAPFNISSYHPRGIEQHSSLLSFHHHNLHNTAGMGATSSRSNNSNISKSRRYVKVWVVLAGVALLIGLSVGFAALVASYVKKEDETTEDEYKKLYFPDPPTPTPVVPATPPSPQPSPPFTSSSNLFRKHDKGNPELTP